jgi:hypothetical protein
MENIDSFDILIESVKYTSEIIINITEKLNSLEIKISNIEQILNDQIEINIKNKKTIENHDKIIKEIFKNNKVNSEVNFKNNNLKNNNLRTNDIRTNDLRTNDIRTNDIRTNDLRTNDLRTTDLRTNDIETNNTESIIDFNIIQEKEYKSNKNNSNILNEYNEDNEDNTNYESKYKPDILIEKLISHKKNLENQIMNERNDLNSKKISMSGEKILRTTAESLINRRKTNVFRKI